MNEQPRHDDPAINGLIDTVATIRLEQGLLREGQELLRDEHKLLREEIKKNSEENEIIIEFFKAGKGAFKFFGYVGGLIKWIGALAAAIAVIWAVFTHNPIGK